MIQKSNYQLLLELSADINKQIKASPSFAAFHRQHITNFYKHNKKNLEVAQNTFKEYKNKFLDTADFEKNMQEFLATPIEIHL